MIGLSVAVISPGAGSFVLAAIAKLRFLGSGIQAEGWAVRLSSKNNILPPSYIAWCAAILSEWVGWVAIVVEE